MNGELRPAGERWTLHFTRHLPHPAGSDPPWSSGERWQEVHPGYVEHFGPQAATIGAPES
jgi:hypothetical protein